MLLHAPIARGCTPGRLGVGLAGACTSLHTWSARECTRCTPAHTMARHCADSCTRRIPQAYWSTTRQAKQ